MPVGKPRVFKTEQELLDTFNNYIEYCKSNKELPNIAGFVVFADIGRQTFYDYKDRYPYTYKRINDILENATINNKDINDTFKIFYMKNKFDYRDRQEIEADVKQTNITISLED